MAQFAQANGKSASVTSSSPGRPVGRGALLQQYVYIPQALLLSFSSVAVSSIQVCVQLNNRFDVCLNVRDIL